MSESNITQIPRYEPAQLRQIGALSARQAGTNVEGFFQQNKDALAPLVAGIMNPDRLLKVAQTAIRQNPKLRECTVKSLFGAIVLCAMMGLEPNTHEQLCFLIPRIKRTPRKDEQGRILKDKNGRWLTDETYEVNVQMGYRGRIKLAYNSPKLRELTTHVIHEGDKYRIIEGSSPRIEHEPKTDGDRGPAIIYYARARLDSGAVIFEWMSVRDIHRIRDQYSDAYKRATANKDKVDTTTPWIANPDAMSRKTVLNRFSAYLPTNRQSAIAEAIDGREMTGSLIDMGAVIDEGDPDAAFIDHDDDAANEPETQQQVAHQEPVVTAPTRPTEQPARTERRQAPAPWWDGLDLKGRALSIAQNAPIRTLDEARAHNWMIEPGAGERTRDQIAAALGLPVPTDDEPAKPKAAAPAPKPLPAVSPATAKIITSTDDEDESPFGFGDPE